MLRDKEREKMKMKIRQHTEQLYHDANMVAKRRPTGPTVKKQLVMPAASENDPPQIAYKYQPNY